MGVVSYLEKGKVLKMKQTETETGKLLATIDLTLEDIYALIRKCVAHRYKHFSRLQSYTSVDDMTQDVFLYYLSPMKSTNEIRLNHYIKEYKDKQHIINLIKQTSYQLPLYTLRRKDAKEIPISLQSVIYEANFFVDTLEDVIEDTKLSNEFSNVEFTTDIMKLLVEALNEANYSILKQKAEKKKTKYNAKNLPFMLNIKNCFLAYNRTKIQLRIIQDLADGYKNSELAKKYISFNKDIKIIREVFTNKINKYLRTQ